MNNTNFSLTDLLASAGSLLILLIILLIIFAGSILAAIAVLSLAIVPLTGLWGLFTGQSYARVCDNSEIIYKLNQFGKWCWALAVGGAMIYGVSLLF